MAALSLREDWPRRLRNALLALSWLDPGWMSWVEREIDPHALTLGTCAATARLVEARARALLLRRFHFFGYEKIGELIFLDWPFGDDGRLTPG